MQFKKYLDQLSSYRSLNVQQIIHSTITLIKNYWPLICIVLLGTWLRLYQLNTHGILFGDAARDILVARQAVEDGEIPLLGIPSSVPRFRQGPVSIWIQMAIATVSNGSVYAMSLGFALISVLTIIAGYELATNHVSPRTAYIFSLLLAVSPLSVAHGRTPYHITPIPLAVIFFLWAGYWYWHRRKHSLFWLVLSWTICFQFELALAPLLGVIIWIWWVRYRPQINLTKIIETTGALLIGLSPQLLYDLQNSFSHLGGFAIWVVYRVLSFGGYNQAHMLSLTKVSQFAELYYLYIGRIFNTDLPGQTLLGLLVLIVSLGVIAHRWQQTPIKVPVVIKLSLVSMLVLTVAYLVHGKPGEAYFPPYIPLVLIVASFAISLIKSSFGKILSWSILGLWAGLMVVSIHRHNFFVSTSRSFNYGPSTAEIVQGLDIINEYYAAPFSLTTSAEAGKYPTYFDNYRALAAEYQIPLQDNALLTATINPNSLDSSQPESGRPYTLPATTIYVR